MEEEVFAVFTPTRFFMELLEKTEFYIKEKSGILVGLDSLSAFLTMASIS